MEIALKAALTATVVASLLAYAGRCGPRVAGAASGLPVTTLLCLLLLALEQGAGPAAEAAAGGVVGCTLAPLFALAYGWGARRLSPAPTLMLALACMAIEVAVARRLSMPPLLACLMACVASAVALCALRGDPAEAVEAPPARLSRSTGMACCVGLLSAAVTTLCGAIGPAAAGIVAAMPLIGVVAVVMRHAAAGPGAVRPYLRGYVAGSLGKTAFCAVFVWVAPAWGPALGLAAAAAALGVFGWALLAPFPWRHVDGQRRATARRAVLARAAMTAVAGWSR